MRDFTPNDERPLYLQLADVLRDAIESGELGPGDKLPSRSQLCDRYGLAHMTVGRTIDELHREGLLLRRQGSGVYVRHQEISKEKPRG
jgi:GntR family transcriptional regulator